MFLFSFVRLSIAPLLMVLCRQHEKTKCSIVSKRSKKILSYILIYIMLFLLFFKLGVWWHFFLLILLVLCVSVWIVSLVVLWIYRCIIKLFDCYIVVLFFVCLFVWIRDCATTFNCVCAIVHRVLIIVLVNCVTVFVLRYSHLTMWKILNRCKCETNLICEQFHD